MNKLIGWDCVWGEKERGSTSEEFINSIVCRCRLSFVLFSHSSRRRSFFSSGFYYSVYIPSPHQQRRDTTKQQARSISNIRALKPRESSETMMTMWRRRWAWAWALPDSDSIAESLFIVDHWDKLPIIESCCVCYGKKNGWQKRFSEKMIKASSSRIGRGGKTVWEMRRRRKKCVERQL